MKKIIAFLPANRDGCALWRMHIPHMNIQYSKFVHSDNKMPIEKFIDADMTVIQRLTDQRHMNAVTLMHNVGMKVVYDLDDNLWNIPKYNPGAQVWGVLKDGVETVASMCDALSVSTEELKKAVRDHMPKLRSKPIWVINNAIDYKLFPEKKLENEEFVVGWGGTQTHSEDTAETFDAILPLFKDNSMRFDITGPLPDRIRSNPRVKQIKYVPISLYPAALASWSWDLFLAPLTHNKFNRCKSNIKILEAAAVGSPILVSGVGPYRDFCAMDKELRYLQCDSDSEWRNKIIELKNEPGLRKHLVNKMRQVINENFHISKTSKLWIELVESL